MAATTFGGASLEETESAMVSPLYVDVWGDKNVRKKSRRGIKREDRRRKGAERKGFGLKEREVMEESSVRAVKKSRTRGKTDKNTHTFKRG
jgi:hypothetical protein